VAVLFAREHHLLIAVRSSGHGHVTPANGALLINFVQMKVLHINPEASTARVEPDVRFGDLIKV
jgi:FAD/FMN-containing dehydrogenase